MPIVEYREKILDAIEKNTVVVVEGPTGCGKTTQVPQYILDKSRCDNRYCNIIVAQPRRIAASSNAKRVSRERNWELGTVVGYQVNLNGGSFASFYTKFCINLQNVEYKIFL